MQYIVYGYGNNVLDMCVDVVENPEEAFYKADEFIDAGYDVYEQDGNFYIKILTENETETTYDITIDCNITPDPRSNSVTRKIELFLIQSK